MKYLFLILFLSPFSWAVEPTMNDVFLGRARFQTVSESQQLSLNFSRKAHAHSGSRLNLFFDRATRKYYTMARLISPGHNHQIVLMSSSDGVTFTQIGLPLFNNLKDTWRLYDPHLAFDGRKYILTMECNKIGFRAASVCISTSTNPWNVSSWTAPEFIVNSNQGKSASTGVTLADNGKYYLSWTMVDDGPTRYVTNGVINSEDGQESTSSMGSQLYPRSPTSFVHLGASDQVGRTLMGAERNPYCNNSWDCNNADIQDWFKDPDDRKYYAIYNGGNYYRCIRPDEDKNRYLSRWAISLRRSNSPLGSYNSSPGILIDAENLTTCGISYPTIARIGDKIYMYYQYYTKDKQVIQARSKLIWSAPLRVTRVSKNRTQVTPQTFVYSENIERIENLFVYLLGRFPARSQVNQWLQHGKTHGMDAVVRGIFYSKEHRLIWARRNNAQKVTSIFKAVLHRNPSLLERQNTIDNMNKLSPRLRIINQIIYSAEYRNKF